MAKEIVNSIDLDELTRELTNALTWEPSINTVRHMLYIVANSLNTTATGCLERDALTLAARCLERLEIMAEEQKAAEQESKPVGVGSQPHSALFEAMAEVCRTGVPQVLDLRQPPADEDAALLSDQEV